MKLNGFFKLHLILTIGCFLLACVAFTDVRMYFSGKTIDFNTAKVADLTDKALIEGDIDFVYGPFATLETSEKRFGVTTSTSETPYYIVTYTGGKAYAVFSTTDEEMISKLNALADEWYEYLTNDDIEKGDFPEGDIPFKGKLWDQPSHKDYKPIYDDTIEDLVYVGADETEFAPLMIVEGEIGKEQLAVFFISAAIALIGIILFVIRFVKWLKNRKISEY